MAKFYPVIQALPTTTRTIWPQTKDPVHRTPHEKKGSSRFTGEAGLDGLVNGYEAGVRSW